MEDWELVQAVLAGDRDALDRLYREYEPVVRRIVRRLARPALTDDLVHDIFSALIENDYRKLRAWRARSSLKTYLCKVTANAARDQLRGPLYREMDLVDNPDDLTDPNRGDDSPFTQVLARELHRGLHSCLESLPALYRELIRWRFWRDEPPRRIAEIMTITVNRVSVGLHRATKRMQQCLNGRLPDLFWLEPFEPHDPF